MWQKNHKLICMLMRKISFWPPSKTRICMFVCDFKLCFVFFWFVRFRVFCVFRLLFLLLCSFEPSVHYFSQGCHDCLHLFPLFLTSTVPITLSTPVHVFPLSLFYHQFTVVYSYTMSGLPLWSPLSP